MMLCNAAMQPLMADLPALPAETAAPVILACADSRGRVYYHAGLTTTYYGPFGACTPGGPGAENYPDLSKLEWDINDLHINAAGPHIGPALRRALAIVRAWQTQMEQDFPEIPFDIFLCVDDGRHLIEESECRSPSVTVHFCARRDDRHYIHPESMSGQNTQPMLLVYVNPESHAEKENTHAD